MILHKIEDYIVNHDFNGLVFGALGLVIGWALTAYLYWAVLAGVIGTTKPHGDAANPDLAFGIAILLSIIFVPYTILWAYCVEDYFIEKAKNEKKAREIAERQAAVDLANAEIELGLREPPIKGQLVRRTPPGFYK